MVLYAFNVNQHTLIIGEIRKWYDSVSGGKGDSNTINKHICLMLLHAHRNYYYALKGRWEITIMGSTLHAIKSSDVAKAIHSTTYHTTTHYYYCLIIINWLVMIRCLVVKRDHGSWYV
jgi:hypothetical protein